MNLTFRVSIYALVLAAFSLATGTTAVAEAVTFDIGGVQMNLTVAPEHPEGYKRDDYLPNWGRGVGGGCFNVRDQALADESFIPVVTVPASRGRCRVVTGLWYGPYTGETFTRSSDVDVDHVVALNEAHQSGGWDWDDAKKKRYANFLEDPFHLIVVDDHENQTVKNDRDPSDYLPREEFRCAYIAAWIAIKFHWSLTVDPAEVTAIQSVLATC